jgi:hypothetical protein
MHDPDSRQPTGEGRGGKPGVRLGGQKSADRGGAGGQGRLTAVIVKVVAAFIYAAVSSFSCDLSGLSVITSVRS